MSLIRRGAAWIFAAALGLSLAACGIQTEISGASETPDPSAEELPENDLPAEEAPIQQGEAGGGFLTPEQAAALYQETEGDVCVLAVTATGSLYVVENGNAVGSVADLEGKTIAAWGRGDVPESALRYLLRENGVDPDSGVYFDWKDSPAACTAALQSGEVTLALLPEVPVLDSIYLRPALDLAQEWEAVNHTSALVSEVLAVRRSFAEAHPKAVENFLALCGASTSWGQDHREEVLRLAEERLGVPNLSAADLTLSGNAVFLTGENMAETLSGYFAALYGEAPGEDFYYPGNLHLIELEF